LQKETPELAATLLEKGLTVLVETNGSLDITILPPGCCRIIDIKTPSSNESDQNNFSNLKHIKENDEIKFVIANQEDYHWTKKIISKYKISEHSKILLSPANGYIECKKIAEWMLKDNLHARLQPQLHKILWSNDFKEADIHG